MTTQASAGQPSTWILSDEEFNMPWMKKRSRLFYFRSRRAGGRVVSEAVPAIDGPMIALADQLLREFRRRVRAEQESRLDTLIGIADRG